MSYKPFVFCWGTIVLIPQGLTGICGAIGSCLISKLLFLPTEVFIPIWYPAVKKLPSNYPSTVGLTFAHFELASWGNKSSDVNLSLGKQDSEFSGFNLLAVPSVFGFVVSTLEG